MKDVIGPPTPDIDGPPSTTEGEIVHVDVDHDPIVTTRRSVRICQECDAAYYIERISGNVLARVRIYNDYNGKHLYVHFCSRECWASWASSDR